VLEIGTGSGYQTAILCELGAKVFSIERHKPLSDKAKTLLEKLGYMPKIHFGDGFKGLPAFAPFDKIIITCGAPDIPQLLFEQLKTGGVMVVPVGEDVQVMKTVVKKPEKPLLKNLIKPWKSQTSIHFALFLCLAIKYGKHILS